MATGVTGYFDLAGNYGITVRIHYKETYDETANTSAVAITGVQVASSWAYGMTYYLDGTITVAGATAVSMSSGAGSHAVRISALNTFATAGGTLGSVSGIAHNADGSKAITISASVRGYTLDGDYNSGWSASGSKGVTLTTIPRASTIGATDANIGAVSMIAVARKSSNYTHTIQYKFGSLSGYITADGGTSASAVKISDTSISFTVPTSFFAQIPNAKSGECTLTCTTYSGSTQIGAAQTCKFTCTAAQAACSPAVSGTVVDSNAATVALTGDAAKLVRYHSTALCTIKAEARNSATIKSKTIGGVAVSGDTRSIANVETNSVTFAATDSRGYSGSATVKNTMIEYVRLTNNATAGRTQPTDGNAVITLAGAWFNGSFGAVANALTAKYKLGSGDLVDVPLTYSGNTYAATVQLSGLTYTESFAVEVTVSDKLESVTKSLTILPGIPVFDWGENDFNFHVPVNLSGSKITNVGTPTEAGDAATKAFVETSALMMGKVTLIPENSDLNDYTVPGCYAISKHVTAETCTNIPVKKAGRIYVYDASGASTPVNDSDTYVHRTQRFEPLTGGAYPVYERYVRREGATTWQYDNWYPITLPNGSDYVTAQGTSGEWYYRKWNSGRAECYWYGWITPSVSASAGKLLNKVYSYAKSYPFTFTATPTAVAGVTHDNGYGFVTRLNIDKDKVSVLWEGGTNNASAGLSIHVTGKWK